MNLTEQLQAAGASRNDQVRGARLCLQRALNLAR